MLALRRCFAVFRPPEAASSCISFQNTAGAFGGELGKHAYDLIRNKASHLLNDRLLQTNVSHGGRKLVGPTSEVACLKSTE